MGKMDDRLDLRPLLPVQSILFIPSSPRWLPNVGLHARFRASHASPGSARCRDHRVLDRMHRMGKMSGRLDLSPLLPIRSILSIPSAPCWLPNVSLHAMRKPRPARVPKSRARLGWEPSS